MDERKEYWIRIFIKKCTYLNTFQEQLDFYFKWCSNTYNVSDEYLEELKEKYTIDDYTNRLISTMDKHFSIEDLKEIIKFYSTSAGKKILDYSFLQDVGKVGLSMSMQIEKDFAMGNNRYNEKN